jgi:mannose-6-phosphate isomerase-like protein (cupin superfamily)
MKIAEVLRQTQKGGGIVVLLVLLAVSGCAVPPAKESTPGALPPGVTRRPVLEASLGTPPPVGWKSQVQERTRPQPGKNVVRHTNSALYYTLERTHELVRGDTVQTFPRGQAVFVPAGVEHIHRMLPLGSTLLTFEIYFARGDASRPTPPPGARLLYFSEKPLEVIAGVHYTVRVDEFTFLPGARWDLTPREPLINYVLEGIKTRRVADQVLRHEPGSALELPIGTRLTVSNEGTTPMRFLAVVLVPTPAPPSASPR